MRVLPDYGFPVKDDAEISPKSGERYRKYDGRIVVIVGIARYPETWQRYLVYRYEDDGTLDVVDKWYWDCPVPGPVPRFTRV